MIRYGGMQLTPEYKSSLDPLFVSWYLSHFHSRRMGYVHWSAGWRDTNFFDYHVVVTQERDGGVKVHRNTDVMTDLHAHTWGRNTDAFSLCVACMLGATTGNLGTQVPTPGQLNALVTETARILYEHRIPVGNLMTHAEAADNVDQGPRPPYPTPGMTGDGALSYGPLTREGPHACERWDWWVWISPHTYQILACTEPRPKGFEPWPDWFRGTVARKLQKLSEKDWKKEV